MIEQKKLLLYFRKKWKKYEPLFMLFKTNSGKYLYDSGTNKILLCKDHVYNILEVIKNKGIGSLLNDIKSGKNPKNLIDGLKIIKEVIRKEGILQTNPKKLKIKDASFENIEELSNKYLKMVTLEVTEKCNLRCKYCIYEGTLEDSRVHGNKIMNWETAKKSIDILKKNSVNQKEVAVTFYGGEPLLNFSLIKKSVIYSNELLGHKDLTYSITTNGTLLTEEIAEFFFKNNFGVMVSLDGPKEIHDKNRIDSKGNGTFSSVIKGLKLLVETFGSSAKDKISLSMVYAPPYSKDKINQISKIKDFYPWLDGLNIEITYPVNGSLNNKLLKKSEEEYTLTDWVNNKHITGIKNKKIDLPFKNFINKPLIKVMRRRITNRPIKYLYPNGCCVPGVRKIYVEPEGKIRLCEQIGDSAPYLGDVNKGVDTDLIKRVFINEYIDNSNKECSSCWANQLCDLCYQQAYKNRSYNKEKKYSYCLGVKNNVTETLITYVNSLKIDPDGLNYLNDVVLK